MRIAICWTFGVWKTTLINSVEYENKLIDLEREIENISPLDNPVDFNIAVFNNIIWSENKYRATNKSFITNSSHIDNLAYMLKYSQQDYLYFKHSIRDYDIIFYIPIEFPLEKDWFRYEDENLRREIDWYIQAIMQEFKWDKYVLRWPIEQRIKQFNMIMKKYENNKN